MKGAGLTVGGFYAHFRSKEALVAETLPHVLQKTREELFEGLEALEGAEFLRAIAERYLSARHRDNVNGGCALPAVLSEVLRAGKAPRAALAKELERFIAEFAKRWTEEDITVVRARVLAVLAVSVGGLTLARAVSNRALSDEILRACRGLVAAAARLD